MDQVIAEALAMLQDLKLKRPATGHLPMPLSSFAGREQEIDEIKRLLGVTRLLTLTGAGGVGKTRLALKAASESWNEFTDGVWWVELGALAHSSLVPQSVAGVLGVREETSQPTIATLVNHLRFKHALIVLDNCEHLVTACAELAQGLLGACPALKILTTSREPLGISGERTRRVPSLSIPGSDNLMNLNDLAHFESIRLFIDRARAVKSDFALTEPSAPPLAQVVRRLDGIPLAIELAAARSGTLTIQQIAARLDDSFNLLTHGSRTALQRHQTLRATIDWSYSLLSEQEKLLFHRLAVFASGWTLEAAESVCAGEALEHRQVLDVLSRLVDKSLVTMEQEAAALCRSSLSLDAAIGDRRGMIACIAAFGGVALTQGQAARTAHLFGAVDALLASIGARLLLSDSLEYHRNLVTVRTQMDEGAFARAWRAGHALSMEQAIAYAVQDTPDLPLTKKNRH